MNVTEVDPLKTCPYDNSHRIRKSRFQVHLLHCRQSTSASKRKCAKICPYNVFHVIPVADFEAHVADCPNRKDILEEIEETMHIGSVPLEELNKVYVPPAQENWDEDPPAESYDPLKQARSKRVLLAPAGLSNAKKRSFRRAEIQRFRNLEGRSGRFDKFSTSVKEKNYRTFRSPQKVLQSVSLPRTTKELDEYHQKVINTSENDFRNDQTDFGMLESDEDEIPEFHLRPPRTRSIALSTSCNSSCEDLNFDMSRIFEMIKDLTLDSTIHSSTDVNHTNH